MPGASSWRSARPAARPATQRWRRFMPRIADVVRDVGPDRVRAALPVLRALRRQLDETLRQPLR